MVGSEDENYLRYLQDAKLSALYPWSLREFSSKELARMGAPSRSHPQSGKGDYHNTSSTFSLNLLPINAVLRFNSAFPYGSNDGAVWAGRGLTSAIDLGFALRAGPLSLTVNPVAFRAENTAFRLQAVGVDAANEFVNPISPSAVDRPQRFGNTAYARLDPGESTLRLDALGLTAGVSTANIGWGPMEIYPFIIGANAPGFEHAFAGTSMPVPIWIGRLHGRVYWGRLSQSSFSPVSGTSYYSSTLESGTKRFMTGAIAIFEPRGADGLELGVARFFHSVWPRSGIPRSYFTKPFEGFLKHSLGGGGGFVGGTDPGVGDNQLASVFARWVFPASQFELYGEYGREDHSSDLRDLAQEPDHSRTYGLGFRKVYRSDSANLKAVRFEMINYELPTLARHRPEGGTYTHEVMRQGHTNDGQLLGSDAGVGTGAGATLALDRYDSRGRTTLAWTRIVNEQNGAYYGTGIEDPKVNDVSHVIGIERTRFWNQSELIGSLSLVREFNRQFIADAWNLNLTTGLRMHF